ELRAYAAAAVSANARPASRSMAAMGTNVPQVSWGFRRRRVQGIAACSHPAALSWSGGTTAVQRRGHVDTTSAAADHRGEGKSATAGATEESKPASGDTTDEFTTTLKLVRR
ncbi:unnamed protein product, partial [Ixodes pacificus]